MTDNFKHLFTPLQITSVEIPNRIYQAAHSHAFEDHVENYGLPGEKELYYQVERAKGGAGLVWGEEFGKEHQYIENDQNGEGNQGHRALFYAPKESSHTTPCCIESEDPPGPELYPP